ncbi:NDR1/HIN1-like protein 12 [Ipomoea triloba]|uniref:NDR1/HIN1-like protein 12 n=1 Tax=Ipomoea triloba TaxID=35885 RepID=UPI00125D3BE3|nr:NDR1/HIN1-like protein 12 [Ipomoea triloba]GME09196.1 NDR1/HIN1-like protein 12 [Ipomoea batatas]
MPKPVLGPERRTNPLIWCAAIICTLLTLAVIFTGIAVFIGYMVVKPKVPQMSIASAQLERISYDMASVLTVKAAIVIKAENGNAKAHSSFYHTHYTLSFHGVKVAYLIANDFDVPKNSSLDLYYPVESTPIPLTPEQADTAESALRQRHVVFDIQGETGTRWRVWLLGSVKFRLHLDCQLKLPINGTIIYPNCSTRSR